MGSSKASPRRDAPRTPATQLPTAATASGNLDLTGILEVAANGMPVENLWDSRVASPAFGFAVPENNTHEVRCNANQSRPGNNSASDPGGPVLCPFLAAGGGTPPLLRPPAGTAIPSDSTR